MRTHEEMMKLILDKAINDERIRAVTMEGSRVSPSSTCDMYSDFDICYYVTNIQEFTNDKSWIEYFGDILIVQCPVDWYSHPYDYRIDLTLIDVCNIGKQAADNQPRTVLLNKDNLAELQPIDSDEAFYIRKPTEKEYFDTCNEFRWLSIYVTKGLCRHELYYAKQAYDVFMMEMFIRMLNWKVALKHDFRITTGSGSKYLKKYLSEEEMERFSGVFPNGDYTDIWSKLFLIYDYFAENAEYVAENLKFNFASQETKNVRDFLMQRKKQFEYEVGQEA